MVWNLWHTASEARRKGVEPIPVPVPEHGAHVSNTPALATA